MITKKTQPYELLVRWKDGAFAGASYRTVTTVADDQTGEVYSVKEGDPQNVEDLSVLLDQVRNDAQSAADVQATAQTEELARSLG